MANKKMFACNMRNKCKRICSNAASQEYRTVLFGLCNHIKRNVHPVEIIPKRKSKVRRVKAWAWFWGIRGTIVGGLCANTINHGAAKKFPCTILIEEKYIKEKNNAR